MKWQKISLDLPTRGKGLYAFSDQVNLQLRSWKVRQGMCFLYCPHTSASLTINENFDPSAQADLETSLERLVPESDRWYTHDTEGPDDASSHIRAMLTDTSLSIPIDDGRLSLGTWQGVYLFEHRSQSHDRQIWLRVLDMSEE
ncbi:MAG: secondary thiamine-phosphate synthase enzyme YjbQ [Chloroflexi bacterium]|nr:secondary thiamine-phosphate synthase enzyme YjbQ [Chloroflexota bacterium]